MSTRFNLFLMTMGLCDSSVLNMLQAVYHMPTQEEEMPSTSIPLALQSTFYKVLVCFVKQL